MGDMQFNGTPEEWDALVKKNRQTTVKLYTEEQVRKAALFSLAEDATMEKILDLLTPIELPTDEEIDEMGKDVIVYNDTKRGWFIEGLKFMRDKILNK